MCNVIQGKVRSYMQRNQKTRKSAVEGGGWDVLFIPEDGSPAPVLLLGIVQTYPGSTDTKIC